MSRTARVLVGLIGGAILGIVLAAWAPQFAAKIADIVQPVGRLWLNALQMTVVPLVVALVIVGVATTSDAAASGRTARRAIIVFLVLLSAGACFAAIVAPLQLGLLPRDQALIDSLRAGIGSHATQPVPVKLSDFLASIVPSNAIAAAAASAMLPLVVCALLFGFALVRVAPARRAPVVELFQTLSEVMITVVRWVLAVAPIGVFALAFAVCVEAGVGVISVLGWYVLAQCTLYLVVTLGLYFVAAFWGDVTLRRFATAILPSQVIAASTQSSLATLPSMIEVARTRLGCSPNATALVLPMAVSLFRMTSPVQYIGVSAYIAWIYGIDLTVPQLAAGAALAVVISLGSVGLPGQVSFMATNMPVAQAMGLPIDPMGLMIAVETVPDVFATLGNVTGDLTATTIVAREGREGSEVSDSYEHTARQ
jgi:Na+/H+-dicarboxylate symporter